MKKILLFFFLLLLTTYTHLLYATITPLEHGHAHNDYLHKRPLFDALDNGFTSIVIDVYLYKNELKVSHNQGGLEKKQTIEQLYLDPIKKIIEQNGGVVYKGQSTPVIFMIDFKTGGSATYLKLKEVLRPYESMITVYKNDSVIHQRAIDILISGRSPIDELLEEDTSMATIDARISIMKKVPPPKVITRYSSSWDNYFSRTASGDMTAADKVKLNSLVTQAHALHKQIRFYGAPDIPKVWRTLLNAGVDWINTDKLKEFREFYNKEYKK